MVIKPHFEMREPRVQLQIDVHATAATRARVGRLIYRRGAVGGAGCRANTPLSLRCPQYAQGEQRSS